MVVKRLKAWLDDWADFMDTSDPEFQEALAAELGLYISDVDGLQNAKDMIKESRKNLLDAMLRIEALELRLKEPTNG